MLTRGLTRAAAQSLARADRLGGMQRPFFGKGLHRQLHTKKDMPKGTRQWLGYGNHAMVYGLASAIQLNGRQAFPESMILISEEFWIEKAVKYHGNRSWGQTLASMPEEFIVRFIKLFPDHPSDQLLTMHQVHAVLEETKRDLQAQGIELIRGNIDQIKPREEGGYQVTFQPGSVEDATLEKEGLKLDDDVYAHNWQARPFLPYGVADSHVVFYHQDPSLLHDEEIILIGDSVSVDWFLKDFETTKVNTFGLGEEKPVVPANNDINVPLRKEFGQYVSHNIRKHKVQFSEDGKTARIIERHSGEFVTDVLRAAAATGFEYYKTDKKFDDGFPKHRRVLMGDRNFKQFVTPAANVPNGALITSVKATQAATGVKPESILEPSFINPEMFRKTFAKHAKAEGIDVPERFYEAIISGAAGHQQHNFLDSSEASRRYLATYVKHSGGEDAVSVEQQKQFLNVFDKTFDIERKQKRIALAYRDATKHKALVVVKDQPLSKRVQSAQVTKHEPKPGLGD